MNDGRYQLPVTTRLSIHPEPVSALLFSSLCFIINGVRECESNHDHPIGGRGERGIEWLWRCFRFREGIIHRGIQSRTIEITHICSHRQIYLSSGDVPVLSFPICENILDNGLEL